MNTLSTTNYDYAEARKAGQAQTEGCQVSISPNHLLTSTWDDVSPGLSRLICAMSVPQDRVEDVLQDVYLISLQKSPKNLDADGLRQWLFRVTVNRCNLEHRRRRRWKAVWSSVTRLLPIATNQRGNEDAASQNERRRLIQQGLESLPDLLRSVLVLRYFSEFNSKEIGAILELPHPTVRSHLRRGRQLLATELRQMGFEDE